MVAGTAALVLSLPALEQDSSVSRRASRRLPAVPRASARLSRPLPLPPVPTLLSCRRCKTCITSKDGLLPSSSMPSSSKSFFGFSGKASLFTKIHNVKFGRPTVHLMVTGAHTLQPISCGECTAYLGFKIVRAHETTEKWKEGHCLLELESLGSNPSSGSLSSRSLSLRV